MRNPLLRAPAAGQDHAPRPAAGQHGDKASQPGARGFGAFLRLGTLGFGGPSAVMGYMQRDLVQQRGWIARQDFLEGVALGQTMPGPLAAQVAMWGGVPAARRGRSGGPPRRRSSSRPSAWSPPSAALYVHYAGLRAVQSLFYGIAPAVMAIIAIAAYKLVRLTDGKDRRAWAVTAVVFAATAITGQEPIYLIIGAGLLMILLDARPPLWLPRRRDPADPGGPARPQHRRTAAGLSCAGYGGRRRGPGLALPVLPKTGALVFGSGLAIVPLLRDGVIAQHHWLTQSQFLDAVAMA